MLISANSTDNILLVDGMNISERVEYSTLLSFFFLVIFWMCSVYIYFDRGGIFFPFISCSFRYICSHLEERVEYSSLCFDVL